MLALLTGTGTGTPGCAVARAADAAPADPEPPATDAGDAGDGRSAASAEEGPIVDERLPPAGSASWPRACSQRRPFCVHLAPGTRPALALSVLDAAERAWATLTGSLALPPPDPSPDGAWHVYVVAASADAAAGELDGGATALLEGRDVVARYDRGSSFALVDRATSPGCDLDLALARAVARGSIWRAAPATDRGSAIAESETFALLATPCADARGDATTFQEHPELTPIDARSTAFARGAALFFGWLDAKLTRAPGALVDGILALSPTPSSRGWRWPGRPTGFDVLRSSLRDAFFPGSRFEDAIVHFSVDRASADPPARAGWHVEWPAHPRRLLAPAPVSPLGATYVVVDTAGRPAGASLHLDAEWEDYGRMRWVAVKVGPSGQALGQIPLASPSPDRSTHATVTVEGLDAAARVLVVGVDVGDTEGPFDPTALEWEPHGWMLTLASP